MSESNNNYAFGLIPPSVNRNHPPDFWRLDDETFEELVCALMKKEPDLQNADLMCKRGQKQYGVDVKADRKSGDGKVVASCKCYKEIHPDKFAEWSDDFLVHLDTYWKDSRVRRFVLAVASLVNERKRAEALEKEKVRFAAKGIDYLVWEPRQLQELLRPHPGIVWQFLGPEWVPRLCGFVPQWPFSSVNGVNLPSAHQLTHSFESMSVSFTRLAQALEEVNLVHRLQLPVHDRTFTTRHTLTGSAVRDMSLAAKANENEREPVLQARLSQQGTTHRSVTSVPGKLEHWFFIALFDNWYIENGRLKKSRWKLTSSLSLAYAMLVNPTDGKAHVEFFLNEDKLDLRGFFHRAWSGHKAHSVMLAGVPDRLVLFTRPRDWHLVWDDEEELGEARDVTEFLADRALFERSLGDLGSPVAKSLLETLLWLFACEQANLDETEDPFEFSEEAEAHDEQGWEDDDDEQQSLLDAMDEQNPGFFHGPWDETRLAELGAVVSRLFSSSYCTGEFARNIEILPRNDLVARPLTDPWLLLSGSRRQPPTVDWSDTEFKPFFFRPARKSGVCA